jgi:uncharacterized protein
MSNFVKRASDIWVCRHARTSDSVRQARSAVAQFKPIVVVTGGSRGIGAALAERFAVAGHDLAIIGRDAPALETAAKNLRQKTGRTVVPIVCDVTNAGAPALIDEKLRINGFYFDVLVNNAAIGLAGAFEDHAEIGIDALIALNIAALTRLMNHSLKGMRARQRGGILNVASL